MITILQRPVKTIPVFDGMTDIDVKARWVAAQNDVDFVFRRQDAQIVSVLQSPVYPGKIRVTVSNIATIPAIDSYIYIGSPPKYDGSGKILASAVSGTGFWADVDMTYIGDQFTGWVNVDSRKNYFLRVELYVMDNDTFLYSLAASKRPVPSFRGDCTANLSTSLMKYLVMNNGNDYSPNTHPYQDKDTYRKFRITLQEFWAGSSNTKFTINDDCWATNSIRQPRASNGSNLFEFVPYINDTHKGKLISDFLEPTYFGDSYPWDIGMIISEYLTGNSLVRFEDNYDLSSAQTGTTQDNLLKQDNPGEYRIMIKGGYTAKKFIDLYIKVGGVAQVGYVQSGYVASGYAQLIPPSPSGATPYQATEKKRIRIKNQCYDNPVYIAWKGMEGGWNYWLFYKKQIKTLQTKVESEVERNITDLATTSTINDYIQKSGEDKILVGADGLDSNDMAGLRKMMLSPKVQMWLSGATNPVWTTVRVLPGTFQIDDNSVNKNDIQLVLQLNDPLTLSQ